MSGVIYSLAVYGSLYNFHQQKLLSLAILFFVILKLSANESVNHLLGVDSILGGITIITDAHLYGAIVGFAFFVVQSVIITLYFYDKKNNQKRLSTQFKSREVTEEKL
jgi:glycerol-3-phosphate acyltransferase PlsY